jgi:hypothetical protein
MMLKEILTPDIHYYTEVFDNPEELIKEIELMDKFQDMGSQVNGSHGILHAKLFSMVMKKQSIIKMF